MKTCKKLIIGVTLICGVHLQQSCSKSHTYVCTCYETIEAGYPPYKTDTFTSSTTTTNPNKTVACASYSTALHINSGMMASESVFW